MMPFIACTSGIAYVINAEDRLVDIAQQKLGDSSRWTEITKPDGTHFTQFVRIYLRDGFIVKKH